MAGDDAEALGESFRAASQHLERALVNLLRAHHGVEWQGVAAEAYRSNLQLIRIRGERVRDELRNLSQK